MTVGTFVTSANEITVAGFWREHVKGELRTRKTHETLRFLSPCWEKKYKDKIFYAGNATFESFVQDPLSISIILLLALYLVYLTLIFLTHGNLAAIHRLMKSGEPLSVRKAHPSFETYCYKCAAGLKPLGGVSQDAESKLDRRREKPENQRREANGGMPLLSDLCLAMRSDPLGLIRGLGEVVTCIYGPAVTYVFPDPLMTTYQHSVVYVSLISILNGMALSWRK